MNNSCNWNNKQSLSTLFWVKQDIVNETKRNQEETKPHKGFSTQLRLKLTSSTSIEEKYSCYINIYIKKLYVSVEGL